jgi:1-acyl-sn-glycerol-3-phosphate acyltransferase
MMESLRRILRQPWIEVELIFADPIHSSGKNRRELARYAEQAIASALSLPLPHKVPGRPSGLPGE